MKRDAPACTASVRCACCAVLTAPSRENAFTIFIKLCGVTVNTVYPAYPASKSEHGEQSCSTLVAGLALLRQQCRDGIPPKLRKKPAARIQRAQGGKGESSAAKRNHLVVTQVKQGMDEPDSQTESCTELQAGSGTRRTSCTGTLLGSKEKGERKAFWGVPVIERDYLERVAKRLELRWRSRLLPQGYFS